MRASAADRADAARGRPARRCCPIVVNVLSALADASGLGCDSGMDVLRTSQLRAAGTNQRQLARSLELGERTLVRHGAWATEAPKDDLAKHRQLVAGTWPLLASNAVLSHGSAAVLHGLPVWKPMLHRVSITRASGGHGARTNQLHVRCAPLDAADLVELDGYRVTSLERTAVDLSRSVSYERAVAILDAALHAKADPQLLADMSAAARYTSGAGVLRRALEFADRRAESVAESISRVRMAEVGLPVPVLQFEVFDDYGRWLGRTDFAWLEYGVVGEFDGAVKYTGTEREVAAAVMAEKRRQAAIEAAGWVVVRWTWSDLDDRRAFRNRIATALADGQQRRHRP